MGFFAVAKKDLCLLAAKPRDLLINIVVPLVLASFIGYLFAPKDTPASKIQIAVVDRDGSQGSAAVVAGLESEDALEVTTMDEAKAIEQIEKGELSAAVILPAGIGERLNITAMFADEKPLIPLLVDPSRSVDYQLVKGLLSKVIMEQLGTGFSDRTVGREQLQLALDSVDKWDSDADEKESFRKFFATGIEAVEKMPPTLEGDSGQDKGGGFQMPVTIKKQEVVRTGSRFNSYAHSFAGMLVMFWFFISIDGGIAVIDERRRGTWRRLRSAPVGKHVLLFSKMVSTGLQALLVAVALYLVGVIVFGIRISGSWAGFAGMLLLGSAVVAAFGMLLSGLGRTEGQVRGYATFFVLMMSFLGGAMFPSWMLPDWLRDISVAIPTRWMMDGLHATTWRGLGLDDVWIPLVCLVGFAVVFTAVGFKTFRWEK